MTSSVADRAPAVRIAAGLLALEALALLGLTVWQIASLVRGDVAELATSIALIVMSLAGVAAIAAFAGAVWAAQSWGRSGGVVAQVLIFAVAVGAVQGPYPHWGTALALAVPAVVTFVSLLLATRAARSVRED
ncbi:histidine kinase [Microbacterium sp. G2-8]|uniref:histidine kinase n=1 Tax=Microbacterium sp. G2-8 TaxID=2842454 RepID=UPI001C8942A7|nr:histidine kinase [Microbacterium sp. G2-8]